MVKNYSHKESQKGSLLIEAMAMLGLIAMVTPMLYKKAAERTTELQDINAAGQLRVVMDAVDSYLYDNYNTIVGLGDGTKTVKSNCTGSSNVTYNFDGNGNIKVPIAHFCEYLPYGFNEKSKTFSKLDVIVKKRDFTSDGRHDLTALLVTTPGETQQMPIIRASRIASMVGTNAGYVEKNTKVTGVQGVWAVDLNDFKTSGFTPAAVKPNTLVATSIRAISGGTNGAENVLHRVRMEEEPWLNTMETTLYMGDHLIDDVKQMIVKGVDLANKDQAILLKDGSGLTIEGTGNANIGGNATIGQKMTSATADVTGLLEAGTANIRGQLTAASAVITGSLSAGGGKFQVASNGATTINAPLTVTGDTTLNNTTIKGVLTAEKESKLKGQVVIGNPGSSSPDSSRILDVFGDARFRNNVKIDGAVEVDSLDVNRVFRAGYISGSGATKQYNLEVDKDAVDILVNNFQVGSPMTTGGLGVTNSLIKLKNTTEIALESPRITLGNAEDTMIVDGNGVSVHKADFTVSNASDANIFKVDKTGSKVEVFGDSDFIASSTAQGNVLAIDTNHAAGTKPTANIYIRKGAIEIAPATDSQSSYIMVDKILSNKMIDANTYNTNEAGYRYDRYQLNPAYTSVMHDIKLTTRGGARLSDILPDFINKGIYVLDGTYKESVKGTSESAKVSLDWTLKADNITPNDASAFPFSISTITSGGSVQAAINAGKAQECATSGADAFVCPTSPWLGFIPAPSCPPGYLKVATLSPIRWAMAQAGRPVASDRTGHAPNEVELVTNRNPNAVRFDDTSITEPWKDALTFQQSTWLNTSLSALKNGSVSYGWSGVIGFIYATKDYQTYIREMSVPGVTFASDEIMWNLFEVWNQQIVGIANVYCYFNRRASQSSTNDGFKNDAMVDRYDQMSTVRVGYDNAKKTQVNASGGKITSSSYVDRLNDPQDKDATGNKYTAPW